MQWIVGNYNSVKLQKFLRGSLLHWHERIKGKIPDPWKYLLFCDKRSTGGFWPCVPKITTLPCESRGIPRVCYISLRNHIYSHWIVCRLIFWKLLSSENCRLFSLSVTIYTAITMGFWTMTCSITLTPLAGKKAD